MRSLLLPAVALLVGCGRRAPEQQQQQPPPPRPPHAAGVDDSFCPFSLALGPWAHELFPGCAPVVYWEWDPFCAGGGCGMPCERAAHGLHGQAVDERPERFAYDARGRFVSATRAGVVDERCTYAGSGDGIDTCELVGDTVYRAQRDAAGRLTSLCRGETCSTVTWRADGLLGEIASMYGGLRLSYDDAHRVLGDGHFLFVRDAQGRIVYAQVPGGDGTTAHGDMAYTYDGDHLVSVDGPFETHMAMTYDDRGRLETLTCGGAETYGKIEYAYSCP